MLCTAQPFRDFVVVSRKLFPDALRPRSLFDAEGVAPGAIVHPAAEIEDGVTIDPGAVIGPRAAIGSGTVIGATAVIGPGVQIGRDCSVGPGASIMHALIGDNVILHAGCRIGQDGFRYHPSAKGHVKVPQLGRVIIQDNVEIGANTAIDRGGSGDTVIGEGTKIDNLVQIGHNCTIGRHCIIVAECGLSGSVVLGDYVMLGGQVGIADHITIGEGAIVAAKSGVIGRHPRRPAVVRLSGDARPRLSSRVCRVAQTEMQRSVSGSAADAICGDDPRRLRLAHGRAPVAQAIRLEIRPGLLRALGAERADIEPVALAAVDRRARNHLSLKLGNRSTRPRTMPQARWRKWTGQTSSS